WRTPPKSSAPSSSSSPFCCGRRSAQCCWSGRETWLTCGPLSGASPGSCRGWNSWFSCHGLRHCGCGTPPGNCGSGPCCWSAWRGSACTCSSRGAPD
ncbi:hypothetical protein, partial [Arthrobacter sp. DR-2P]